MATEIKSVADNIKIFLSKIHKKTTTNSSTIFLVPECITAEHEDMYKPKMVPIGPYHHDERKFMAIEARKHHFLHDFLERNNQVNYDTYIHAMQNLKDRARECYSEEELIPRDDNKFVEVLLIDGCFILELLLKHEEDKRHRHSWAGWDFMAIMSDLLLVENQIPFFVLEKFYATLKGLDDNTSKVELKKLVVNNLFIKYLGDSIHSSRVKEPGNIEIDHLLHLYHEISLPNYENKKIFGNISAQPTFKKSTWAQPGQGQKDHRLPLVIPSATQLSEFGFKLRKQDSRNNSDPDIKHGRIHSTIKIP